MASKGNMIVTLVAQTKNFQDGLKKAGGFAKEFGSVVGGAMSMAFGAIAALAGAVIFFLPNFIKMGEEARKSELRLGNVAKQMGLFGEETEQVTGRISKYAETLSFLTGVDDELTRENQAVLLTFSELGKTAGTAGGAFDRATLALLDLEAAGKDLKAVALGKALQDPVGSMTALRKAGILLTDVQEEQIKAFVESNNLLAAQDLLLKVIEGQVGGTAAAMASSTDQMAAKFEAVVETLSLALLPAVDTIADAMTAWLDSPAGKKALEDMVTNFEKFGDWVSSADGRKAIEELYSVMAGLAESTYNAGKFMAETYANFKAFGEWINSPENKWWVSMFQNELSSDQVNNLRNKFPDANIPAPRPSNAPPTNNRDVLDRLSVTVNGVVSGPQTTRIVTAAVKEGKRLGLRA